MYHETEVTDGFCYRRYNQQFKRTEYLAYSGYEGPHTNNPSYFKRVVAESTQFHRGALYLNTVCWIDLHTKIDNLPGAGTYDISIYHGCL